MLANLTPTRTPHPQTLSSIFALFILVVLFGKVLNTCILLLMPAIVTHPFGVVLVFLDVAAGWLALKYNRCPCLNPILWFLENVHSQGRRVGGGCVKLGTVCQRRCHNFPHPRPLSTDNGESTKCCHIARDWILNCLSCHPSMSGNPRKCVSLSSNFGDVSSSNSGCSVCDSLIMDLLFLFNKLKNFANIYTTKAFYLTMIFGMDYEFNLRQQQQQQQQHLSHFWGFVCISIKIDNKTKF